MLRTSRWPQRPVFVAATGVAATAVAVLGLAGPATASTNPVTAPQSSQLVGSGSATTYNLMQQMDLLFNDAPGCNLITSSAYTQPLNISCLQGQETTTPPDQGATSFYPTYEHPQVGQYQDGYTENPENDYSVQAPPLGSSNGIKNLETLDGKSGGTGASSCASTEGALKTQSFARSSRALASTDCQGLNFVAYALDGVSFFHYPEVNGHNTPSNAINNFTTTNLVDAWTANGANTGPELECWNDPSIGTNNAPSMTYSSAGCEPIILYDAQSGSGTTSTWSGFVGLSSTALANSVADLCAADSGAGTTIDNIQTVSGGTMSESFTGTNGNCFKHDAILENEDRAIINNGDEANALFYFSFGKYQVTCKVGDCGKIPGATGTTTEQLGEINGIAPTAQTILCGALGTDTTGVNECQGTSGEIAAFNPFRFIYNVYSDGSNSSVPSASLSTLNYVSELGFICKTNTINGRDSRSTTEQIDDPITGGAYRVANKNVAGSLPTGEVSKVISSQGFLPMPWQLNEGASTAYKDISAAATSGSHQAFGQELLQSDLVSQSSSQSSGYCLVTTTDGNLSK